jgi:hypothetical protein
LEVDIGWIARRRAPRAARPEKYNSNGKGIWLPTYQLVATIGQPGGPSWDNFDRCGRLCQVLAASIALAKSRTDATNGSDAAPRAQGPPESDAPPPTGDDWPRSLADLEEIPFWRQTNHRRSRHSAYPEQNKRT